MRVRAVLVALAGCSFQTHAVDDGQRAPDGQVGHDAAHDGAVDSAPPAPYMLACSSDTLYRIDVDQGTATSIGPIGHNMDSIAGAPGLLYGVPTSADQLLTIDASTGAATASRSLTPTRSYYGFTYVPSPPAWLLGTGDGSLYSLDPPTGTATVIGSFGASLTVAGDIAYVAGKGVFGTFYGPGCSPTCIASIDPGTGVATVLSYTGPNNGLSMSGFRGELWILDNAGGVWRVDTSNGNATLAFTTGITWADAAQ